MKHNRLIALLIILVMMISTLPAMVFADDELPDGVVAQGECGADGSNVRWMIDTEGTLTIYGSGDMQKYDSWYGTSIPPWRSYQFDFQKVVIKYGVTNIGSCAFEGNYTITSITIPGSVTSIGWKSFEGCDGLTNIDLPLSLKTIDAMAFRACDNLTSIKIPLGVTSIEASTFSECKCLQKVKLPNGLTLIDDHAFMSCENLSDINIPSSVEGIGTGAFYGTALKSFVFPSSAIGITDRIWSGSNSLESITIPKSIQYLDNHAFDDLPALKDIYYEGNEEEWGKIQYTTFFSSYWPGVEVHYAAESDSPDLPDDPSVTPDYSTGFTIGRDNNDFAHSGDVWLFPKAGFYHAENYKLDPEYYRDLKHRISTEDQLKVYKEMYEPDEAWGGSCYGIAATMALVYNKIVDLDHISGDNSGTYHSAASPRYDSRIRNNINYCYLAQSLAGAGSKGEATMSMYVRPDLVSKEIKKNALAACFALTSNYDDPGQFLRALVKEAKQAVKDQKVLMLSYNSHCILITGYEYNARDNLHVVYLYDENCGGIDEATIEEKKHTAGETIFVIEGDFSEGYFNSPFNELHILSRGAVGVPYKYAGFESVTQARIIDPSKIGYYQKGKVSKSAVSSMKAASVNNSAVIQFPECSSFRLRNANNEELIVNPVSERGEKPTLDGNIAISDFNVITKGNSCYYAVTVAPSEHFYIDEVKGIASGEELYSPSYSDINPEPLKVNGTDEEAALDISLQTNGKYMSLTSTEVESATIDADGSITINPAADPQSGNPVAYSFEAYVPAETADVAGINASATADEQAKVSASNGVMSIDTENGNLAINEAVCLSNGESKPVEATAGAGGMSIDANNAINQLNGNDGGSTPAPQPAVTAPSGPTEIMDLPAVKISKPKAAKKSATIKWKKVSKKNLKKIKKVEIQYSMDKSFQTGVKTKYVKAKKTSLKIKKLKSKKKYYVRLRAYTAAGGAVHVSKWSKVKTIKIR